MKSFPFHHVALAAEEAPLWHAWANRGGDNSRQVAGRLLFTSSRLMFVPNSVEPLTGEPVWECARAQAHIMVCPGAWRPKNTLMNWLALQSMLEVECPPHSTEYFWLRHPTSWVRRRMRPVVDDTVGADGPPDNVVPFGVRRPPDHALDEDQTASRLAR